MSSATGLQDAPGRRLPAAGHRGIVETARRTTPPCRSIPLADTRQGQSPLARRWWHLRPCTAADAERNAVPPPPWRAATGLAPPAPPSPGHPRIDAVAGARYAIDPCRSPRDWYLGRSRPPARIA